MAPNRIRMTTSNRPPNPFLQTPDSADYCRLRPHLARMEMVRKVVVAVADDAGALQATYDHRDGVASAVKSPVERRRRRHPAIAMTRSRCSACACRDLGREVGRILTGAGAICRHADIRCRAETCTISPSYISQQYMPQLPIYPEGGMIDAVPTELPRRSALHRPRNDGRLLWKRSCVHPTVSCPLFRQTTMN
jgi:hypothetical protein